MTRTGAGASKVRLRTGVKRKTVEIGIAFRGRAADHGRLRVSPGAAGRKGLRRRSRGVPISRRDAAGSSAGYWKETAGCRFFDPLLDRFYNAAKFQLRAAVAASGRLDGSVWQYNLEWVRDQAFIALALAMSGQPAAARTMLARLLSDFVSDEGATMDSSRFRPWEESEVDQNGVLLFALESYVHWTGDTDLIRENWDKIAKAAAFPLRPQFRHAASGLLVNRREFWERHEAHGIRMGMELAHQLFVVMGLRSAGRLAGLVGRTSEAGDWTEAAMGLRKAMLKDERFSLVETAFSSSAAASTARSSGRSGRIPAPPCPPRLPSSGRAGISSTRTPRPRFLSPGNSSTRPGGWRRGPWPPWRSSGTSAGRAAATAATT